MKQIWGLVVPCGLSVPPLPSGESSASTKDLVPSSWSISGARTQRVLLPGSQTKWNPVPLARKGTVVEQGRESGSVPSRPGILLLQMISAQESGMELDIYWSTDCRDLQDSGHFASFGDHFLLSSNHSIISKAI